MSHVLRPALPFQADALTYALPRSRIALFLEMRLGKTLVTIRWAQAKHKARYLLLAPATVLSAWKDELALEGVKPSRVFCRDLDAALRKEPGWHLWNYELMRARSQVLALPWDVLICDESTRIRNPKAQVTKLLLSRTDHVPCKAILSGLPAPESPLDYVEQFRFLHGSFMGYYNYYAVRKSLFVSDHQQWEWYPRAGTISKIKSYVHDKAFVLTRKEAGIGSRKIYSKRTVDMNPEQKRVYRKAEEDFALELANGQERLTNFVITKILWMARIAGGYSSEADATTYSHAKVTELGELLLGELKNEPVVVWFRFNREIDEVKRYLGSKVTALEITGDTPLDVRHQRLRLFQQGHARILLAQVKCAKFGLDCSRASTAIYFSNGYDYEDRAQSEDRIAHPTKHDPLLYIDLVTRGTVDEDIVSLLRDKQVNSRVFMMRLVEQWKQKHAPVR